MTMSLHRALGLIQFATLCVLCVLSGLLLVATAPGLLGYETFVVKSASMRPLQDLGDLGVLRPVKVEAIVVGDVITYRDPQNTDWLLTRRIQSVAAGEEGKLAMQVTADQHPIPEPLSVEAGMTLGRLAFSIPRLGTLVDFVGQPIGRSLLLGVPALLLTVDWLRGRLRRRNGAVAVVAPPTKAQRIAALLEGGRRALLAGQAELAGRAAEATLILDPQSADAWRLKALALEAVAALANSKVDREHVAA